MKSQSKLSKHQLKWLSLICTIILLLTGCQSNITTDVSNVTEATVASENTSETTTETPVTYDDPAMNYLIQLDQMGARIAGTVKERKAADYITKELESMGYTVKRDDFTYQGGVHSENIIAEKKGTGEGTVLLGAHYDSVDASKGTDDNASGVSVVLRVAKTLAEKETIHTVKFVLFGAEEVGLEGSYHYTSQMSDDDVKNLILMVNLDSLIAGDIAYVYGNPNEQGKYRDFVLELAASNQMTLTTQPGKNPEFPAGTTGPFSDHAPFEELGISFIYFESTNWDMGEKDGYVQSSPENGLEGDFWHTQYDNFEDINNTFPGRPAERLNLISTLLEQLLVMDLSSIK